MITLRHCLTAALLMIPAVHSRSRPKRQLGQLLGGLPLPFVRVSPNRFHLRHNTKQDFGLSQNSQLFIDFNQFDIIAGFLRAFMDDMRGFFGPEKQPATDFGTDALVDFQLGGPGQGQVSYRFNLAVGFASKSWLEHKLRHRSKRSLQSFPVQAL